MMQPMRQTVMPWCTGRSNRCLPCTAPPLVPFHFHEQDVAATARSGLSDPRITSAMIAASTSRPPVVTRPTVVRICVMVALTADSGSPAAITYDPGTRPENTR